MSKKQISWLIIISIISAAAFHFYENYRLKESVIASIKKTSFRVEGIAQYELGINENITYEEYFNELESAIQEIESSINAVENLALTKDSNLFKPSIAYMHGAKEYCRGILIMNKNIVDAKLEKDSMDELIREKDELMREKNRAVKDAYKSIQDIENIEKITNELNNVVRKRDSLDIKIFDIRTSLESLTLRMILLREELNKYLPASALVDKAIYLKLSDVYKTK